MVMKLNKFIGFFAMAAVAVFAVVGCQKSSSTDDDLDPEEAKLAVSVRQSIYVSFSADLRASADINLEAYGLNGEEVYIEGALHTAELNDVVDFNLADLAYPCSLKTQYKLSPRSEFEPEIGKEYDLSRRIVVTVDILDKDGVVLATESAKHDRKLIVTAEADTDWGLLLGQSSSVEIKVKRDADGSIELD